jgi:adhesin transport system outer membrane protein
MKINPYSLNLGKQMFILSRFAMGLMLIAITPAAFPNESIQSIESLLENALYRDPSILSSMAQTEAANLEIETAKKGYWPTFQILSESGSLSNETNLVIEQPLWTGGALTAKIKEATSVAKAQSAALDTQRLQIGLRVIEAWQTLRDSSASLTIHERSLLQQERYEALIKRRVKANTSPSIDLELIQSRIQQTKTEILESSTLQKIALSKLERLVGHEISLEQREKLTRSIPIEIFQNASTDERLTFSTRLIYSHPQIRRSEYEIEAASSRLDQQRAASWPQLILRYQRQLTGPAFPGIGRDRVGVFLSYSSGAGFSNISKEKTEEKRIIGLQQSSEALMQELNEQILLEWIALRREIQRQESFKKASSNAQEILDSYERQFLAGRKTWLEVLNALREMTQNELKNASAEAGAAASLFRVNFRTGMLPNDENWKVQ